MTADEQAREDIDRFILDQIDTVPHLEALLLLWRSRPHAYSVEDLAKGLYVRVEEARKIAQDLLRKGLITAAAERPEMFCYEPEAEKDRLIELTDTIYRKELIRITRMIHAKASPAVREFARSFRFKRERE